MDRQAREARDMAKNLPPRERIKHFWDYYKIHTIVAVIVLILIGTTIYQAVTRVKYDLEMTYYGNSTAFTEEQAEILKEYIAQYIEDIDGNGEKNVDIVFVSSEMAEGNPEYQMAISQKFMAELSAGVSAGYIFDQEYYDYAGPESDMGAMESAFNMCDNAELKEKLGLGDEPVYWCTRALYERETKSEKSAALHENAQLAEKAIRGEL